MYKLLSVSPSLIIYVLSLIPSIDNTEAGSEILVLDKNNFDDAIKQNEYIFVKFYASWCRFSRELSPQYIKAARKVFELELPVKFAEIEASEQQELCEKYNVFGYPTLILFRRGAVIHYYDDRGADDIVMWIKSQVRPAVKKLDTLEEMINLTDTEEVTVIGFFKNLSSTRARDFEKIAESFAKPVFALTANEEILTKYNATFDSIILFNKFSGETSLFVEELTLPNLKSFVEIEAAPLIHELNSENGETIFGGKVKNHVIIFISKKSDNVASILNLVKPVAKEYRKRIMFVSINIDHEQIAQILTYFNIKPSEIPAIGLISNKRNKSKYKMKGNVTTDNLRKFLSDFEANKLSAILLSEPLPKNWNKTSVYTLVASNFVSFTKKSDKTIIVYFYSMDCKSCPLWDPIIVKLGEDYKSLDDIVVAKINVGTNEFADAPFKEIPSIILYKNETNKKILYNGNPKYEDVLQFIQTGDNKNKTNLNTEL